MRAVLLAILVGAVHGTGTITLPPDTMYVVYNKYIGTSTIPNRDCSGYVWEEVRPNVVITSAECHSKHAIADNLPLPLLPTLKTDKLTTPRQTVLAGFGNVIIVR